MDAKLCTGRAAPPHGAVSHSVYGKDKGGVEGGGGGVIGILSRVHSKMHRPGPALEASQSYRPTRPVLPVVEAGRPLCAEAGSGSRSCRSPLHPFTPSSLPVTVITSTPPCTAWPSLTLSYHHYYYYQYYHYYHYYHCCYYYYCHYCYYCYHYYYYYYHCY